MVWPPSGGMSLAFYSEWLQTGGMPTCPSHPAAAAELQECLPERCSAAHTPPWWLSFSSVSLFPVSLITAPKETNREALVIERDATVAWSSPGKSLTAVCQSPGPCWFLCEFHITGLESSLNNLLCPLTFCFASFNKRKNKVWSSLSLKGHTMKGF